MRPVHHWAALVFVAAIVVHLCRIFFTGAFRRPREVNWLIGMTLLLLALAAGFTGYSLPEDLLSGTYANSVLIGHSPSEFLFDFITGFYPTASVSSRVYLSAQQAPRVLETLSAALVTYQKRFQQIPGQPQQRPPQPPQQQEPFNPPPQAPQGPEAP